MNEYKSVVLYIVTRYINFADQKKPPLKKLRVDRPYHELNHADEFWRNKFIPIDGHPPTRLHKRFSYELNVLSS